MFYERSPETFFFFKPINTGAVAQCYRSESRKKHKNKPKALEGIFGKGRRHGRNHSVKWVFWNCMCRRGSCVRMRISPPFWMPIASSEYTHPISPVFIVCATPRQHSNGTLCLCSIRSSEKVKLQPTLVSFKISLTEGNGIYLGGEHPGIFILNPSFVCHN